MNDEKKIIEAVDLKKIYEDGGHQTAALNDVCLSVKQGEFVAIVGASGSGKSTLLHILGGVERLSSGRVAINGEDISRLSVNEAAVFRRRNIGIVYQSYNLIPVLTARENILLPQDLDHRKPDPHFFDVLVDQMGIADKLEHLPSQLSGGQQQRVAIARALVNHPSLLLADEPTGNLDSAHGAQIIDLLKNLNQTEGQTILLVTHDPAIAAQAKRRIEIKDGAILRDEVTGG